MNLKDFFNGEKLIIHMFYWIVILIMICIVLFTVRGYNNTDLSNQFAFGATLSGIILSVLAIIMTLVGEMKTDNTKDSLVRVSKTLEDITKRIDESTEKLEGVNVLKEKIEIFENNINNISGFFSTEKNENNGEKIHELYDSYLNVYNDYINSRDMKLKKQICLSIYCDLKIERKRLDIRRKVLSEIGGTESNIQDFIMGINFVFTKYGKENGEFEDYLKKSIEEEFPEEIKKLNGIIKNA